jgi:beta-glucosidase
VVADGGYLHGALAPGHKNLYEAPIASHHQLRAHGKAVQAYRAEGRHEIGLVVNLAPKHAASDKAETSPPRRRADAYMNRQYLDPVFLGSYPDEMKEIFGDAWPEWPAEDFELIREKLDFVGVNYYMRDLIRHDEQKWPVKTAVAPQPLATVHPDRLGGVSEGPRRDPRLGQATLRRHPALRHRERRRLLRPALRT